MNMQCNLQRSLLLALAATLAQGPATAGPEVATPAMHAKAPTQQTREANKTFAADLNLADPQDFADTTRGFVASFSDPVIKSD